MLTFIKVKFNFNPVIDFFKELKLFTACKEKLGSINRGQGVPGRATK